MNYEIEQCFSVPKERKHLYGEVATDFKIIDIMLDMLPDTVWTNPDLKWLDVGSGQGYISYALLKRLEKSLLNRFENVKQCREHIITNMLFMIEINEFHKTRLVELFGENANIIIDNVINPTTKNLLVDIVVENPPYNINGLIKTPTNCETKKKNDGVCVWRDFLRASRTYLRENGIICAITPAIWLRNDKLQTYKFIFDFFDLLKCRCFSADETNKVFHGKAQTPTSIFTIRKREIVNQEKWLTSLFWDKDCYVNYHFKRGSPIPLKNYRFISKLRENLDTNGHLSVIKTNCLSSLNKVVPDENKDFPFIAIRSRSKRGDIVYEYCKKPTKYQHEPKIIMANKMFGLPFIDSAGVYGISTRDNYVIIGKSTEEMIKIKKYIESDLVQTIFDSFRYRMRYLEREAFLFVPNN